MGEETGHSQQKQEYAPGQKIPRASQRGTVLKQQDGDGGGESEAGEADGEAGRQKKQSERW